MNILLLCGFSMVGTLVCVAQGTVTYGSSPFNIYGNTNQVKPHYPEALVTYGSPQRSNTQTATQRARFYPSLQQRSYYLPQARAYTAAQRRPYAPARQRTFAQPQARGYTYGQPRTAYTAARPRSYPSTHPRPYTSVHPQVYSQVHSQPAYVVPQLRTYPRPASSQPAAPRYLMPARQPVLRPAVRQPIRPVVRQSINTGLRQPVQPIRAAPAQPFRAAIAQPITTALRQPIGPTYTRTLAPKLSNLYRTGVTPISGLPQSMAARPVMPVSLRTYGRNYIPKTPGRNIIPSKPIPPGINHPALQNNKRNNITPGRQILLQTPEKTQAVRNYINGIALSQKVSGTATKGPIKPQVDPNLNPSASLTGPIKPQVPPSSPTGHKLSTFLRTVKNLQDTLKNSTMKQGLIYYDDDVSNKSHHRPTNFAPPTRKLGSLGSPGGSRVTFNEEPAVGPAIIPETKAINQAGSERVKIAQNDKIVANDTTHLTKNSKQNDASSLTNNTAGPELPQAKKIAVAEKPLPALKTANETKPETKDAIGSTKSPKFGSAQVDLGLLKQKVLHSNNSQFLKRVLQVLRKYTKLMKSSMAGKNETRNVLDASNTENKAQISNTNNSEDTQNLEGGMDLSDALHSTKTAVKIFDMLNSASKKKLNSSMVNELHRDLTSEVIQDSPKNSPPESNSGTKALDLMSSNSNAGHDLKDENASKKGEIETGKNVGKPVFNLEKLKHGLERGNAID